MRPRKPPNEISRAHCSDAIERFLDRSWILDRIPADTVRGHRSTLNLLDQWMQSHRVVTLTSASSSDVRAMLKSPHWDAASRRCEALLGLMMRFFQSLKDCKFRADDPFETLIDQELAASASGRMAARLASRETRTRSLVFSRSPAG